MSQTACFSYRTWVATYSTTAQPFWLCASCLSTHTHTHTHAHAHTHAHTHTNAHTCSLKVELCPLPVLAAPSHTPPPPQPVSPATSVHCHPSMTTSKRYVEVFYLITFVLPTYELRCCHCHVTQVPLFCTVMWPKYHYPTLSCDPSTTILYCHVTTVFSLPQCQSTLERQNSLPNVNDLQEGATSPTQGHSNTQSLTRSSSGHSINDQLTESGHALPGSNFNTKSHRNVNTKSRSNPSLTNHKLEIETQYSYPLQRLLAQPFNPETDDFDLLDLPLEPTHIPDRQGYHRSRSGDLVSHSHLYSYTHPHPSLSHSHQLSSDSYHSCVSGTNQLCSHDVRLNNTINASGSNISRSRTDMPDSPRSPADLYPNRSHGNITIEV